MGVAGLRRRDHGSLSGRTTALRRRAGAHQQAQSVEAQGREPPAPAAFVRALYRSEKGRWDAFWKRDYTG